MHNSDVIVLGSKTFISTLNELSPYLKFKISLINVNNLKKSININNLLLCDNEFLDNKNNIQIDPNYLSNKFDRALAYKAFRSGIDLLKKTGFAKSGKNLINDDIEQNIGSETFSGYHLIGTNRMSDDKNSGVVDGLSLIHI